MRKLVYYILLVVLLVICLVAVFLLIALAEEVFNFRSGQVLIYFGYISGFGLFFSIKPFLRDWIIGDKKNKNSINDVKVNQIDKLKEKGPIHEEQNYTSTKIGSGAKLLYVFSLVVAVITFVYVFFWGNSSVDNGKAEQVYICTGPQSEVYHKTDECKGLNRCSGEIKKLTREDAEVLGRHECGICYE